MTGSRNLNIACITGSWLSIDTQTGSCPCCPSVDCKWIMTSLHGTSLVDIAKILCSAFHHIVIDRDVFAPPRRESPFTQSLTSGHRRSGQSLIPLALSVAIFILDPACLTIYCIWRFFISSIVAQGLSIHLGPWFYGRRRVALEDLV